MGLVHKNISMCRQHHPATIMTVEASYNCRNKIQRTETNKISNGKGISTLTISENNGIWYLRGVMRAEFQKTNISIMIKLHFISTSQEYFS